MQLHMPGNENVVAYFVLICICSKYPKLIGCRTQSCGQKLHQPRMGQGEENDAVGWYVHTQSAT
jgi:hypothetical protein